MVGPAVALPAADLRAGLLAGAAVLCLVSRGDFLVVAVGLAVVVSATDTATVRTLAASAVLLAAFGLVLRSFSSSLGALAGAQAVLGPAAVTGPPAAAASAWAGAAALILAAPAAGHRWAAVPFGLAAGLLLAGPSGATPAGLAVRVVAAIGLADLAVSAARWLPPRRAASAAAVCGVVSVVLGWAARPAGGWHRATAIDTGSVVASVVVVLLAAIVAVAGLAAFRRWWPRPELVSG